MRHPLIILLLLLPPLTRLTRNVSCWLILMDQVSSTSFIWGEKVFKFTSTNQATCGAMCIQFRTLFTSMTHHQYKWPTFYAMGLLVWYSLLPLFLMSLGVRSAILTLWEDTNHICLLVRRTTSVQRLESSTLLLPNST